MTLVVLEVVHQLLQMHWSWSLVVAVVFGRVSDTPDTGVFVIGRGTC